MSNFRYIYALIAIILLSNYCNYEDNNKKIKVDKRVVSEALVKVNRKYIDVENQQIDDFMHRRNWTDFTKTKSGLKLSKTESKERIKRDESSFNV